ncbi:MAG: RNA methyltransferase [Proteobacteria bacterium]|jgi:tRNA G18 (ribose-2'-O)-methylase SpoU|nr:MAG: RNA methyltransferase [Pseudomonadota bacterium]
MQLVPIDDPSDPRIAAYRDIRERDLVGRQGRFIAEGKVVLETLLASSRFEAESVMVLQSRLAGLSEILAKAPSGLPVYVVAGPVMDEVAGFPVHRGILAIGRRPPVTDAGRLLASLPTRAFALVLVGISNHDNIGSIFRNAAAFGADAIFLDRTCCDPLYRKAIRVSTGSVLRVPYAIFDDSAAFAGILAENGFESFALSPRGAADIRNIRPGKRTALFLGTEGTGLPRTLLERMNTLRIAMTDGFDSLNVAAASAIVLHHLYQGD